MEAELLFWTKVSAIGGVAGAFSTFCAVVAALYLAREERGFRLRVTASFGQIVHVGGSTPVLTVRVENTGLRTAVIDGFGWTTGFTNALRIVPKPLRLQSAFQLPDYEWPINPPFPWRLEPGESKSTHIRRASFIEAFAEPAENRFFRRLRRNGRARLVRHRVYVQISTRRKVWFGVVSPEVTAALEEAYRG